MQSQTDNLSLPVKALINKLNKKIKLIYIFNIIACVLIVTFSLITIFVNHLLGLGLGILISLPVDIYLGIFLEVKKCRRKIKALKEIESFADERDYKILENDKYTFFVLGRIMGGKCELLLTDHERLIICLSCKPYPVWIWTPDDASEEEMERAYQLVLEASLLDGKHRFNLKYNLANYFIKRAVEDEIDLSISLNMFAYDCNELIKPTAIADGAIHHCVSDDIDELVEFLDLFHKETGVDKKDIDSYRSEAEEYINSGNMYFWKDGHGNNVASCKFAPNGDTASVNLVFTRPEFRRKHYAENLVYEVTKLIIAAGYTPMLYTDADYTASNACYEKIGYVLKGKLCTIG